MLGKLLSTWIGERVARDKEGTKGAIPGFGTAAFAKRAVPMVAALALGGFALKKWREHKRSAPSYPSDAAPRLRASQPNSPS